MKGLLLSSILVCASAFAPRSIHSRDRNLSLLDSAQRHRHNPSVHSRRRTRASICRQRAEKASISVDSSVRVGPKVGSGSYGTVHCIFRDGNEYIGKRAWSLEEIQHLLPDDNMEKQKGRADRCKYYWMVEKHCFEKIPSHSGIPAFQGVVVDQEGASWMLFEKIFASSSMTDDRSQTTLARSMQDVMDLDLAEHREHAENRLVNLSLELGIPWQADGGAEQRAQIIDEVIGQTLEVLVHIHQHSIVHRDLKPGNLLVTDGKIVLIDFGSAADLDTAGLLKKKIGLAETVAISPIYAAPELFVNPSLPNTAVNFDCFSAALIFCQVLFQYLDERTDAGFFRQLADANHQLDSWLETELSQDVRSSGLEEGLGVLALRPGLWNLLQNMLHADPRDRYSSQQALTQWRKIESGTLVGDHATLDSPYLAEVLESFDLCSVEDLEEEILPGSRPLHYVATFRRGEPLGLLLAESDAEATEDMNREDKARWNTIRTEGRPGQVFVQGVVPGSQADEIGIFQVGDQLQGVGELPLSEGGFEKAVELIQDQPRRSKSITLHLDRKPNTLSQSLVSARAPLDAISVVRDQGAWTSRGRVRSSQEDRFILHELQDTRDRTMLLGGVFDGHLGSAAAEFVSERLAGRLSEIIMEGSPDILPETELLESAWNDICEQYRASCTKDDECIAVYDSREGTLDAYTGGQNAVAGTTASIVLYEESKGLLTILNCGDSRSMVVDSDGDVAFCTVDHNPEFEVNRFMEGIKAGLPYSQPECRFSKWQVSVGDYNYAVSRSLEGPFATSVGIISTPDISTFTPSSGAIVVVATDGLWEVMDTDEVARVIRRIRDNGTSAADASKILCSMALEKGSRDNVSAISIFL